MTLPEKTGSTTFLDLFTNVNDVAGNNAWASLLFIAWVVITLALSFITEISTAMLAASFLMILVSGGFAFAGLVNILVPFGFIVLLGVVFFIKLFKDF